MKEYLNGILSLLIPQMKLPETDVIENLGLFRVLLSIDLFRRGRIDHQIRLGVAHLIKLIINRDLLIMLATAQ